MIDGIGASTATSTRPAQAAAAGNSAQPQAATNPQGALVGSSPVQTAPQPAPAAAQPTSAPAETSATQSVNATQGATQTTAPVNGNAAGDQAGVGAGSTETVSSDGTIERGVAETVGSQVNDEV
ncbi:hypothetical protein [Aquisalimonas sp.]|uniref:hypothetical protein n=1 Tax=unclassified Aquisalimonas TaxID=2644645 RepID=UPI0025C6519F|nr:hypothetical protein [Aquisalimonas sp.]